MGLCLSFSYLDRYLYLQVVSETFFYLLYNFFDLIYNLISNKFFNQRQEHNQRYLYYQELSKTTLLNGSSHVSFQ